MKKKKFIKRFVAILCAITLLPLGNYVGSISNAAEESTDTGLEEWTIRDIFMPDRWYDFDYTATTEGNMINTTFTTYISFPNDGNTNLWLGNELNGFVFNGQSGGVNMMHYGNGGSTSEFFALMTSDVAGVELLNNPNLKMTVTVEQSGETGIKVGVYFNDVLYGGSFFEKEGITSAMLPKSISIRRYNGTTQKVYLKSPTQSHDSTEVPTNLENLTLLHAGISDGTQKEFYGDLGVDSLDGTLFSARLHYNANFTRFHFGVKDNLTNMFTGISFRLEGDTIKISNEAGGNGLVNLPFDYVVMDATTAGIGTTFNNTEFLLQISTEFVDHDKGGTENDIKFGVFINGKLYDNQYFYVKDGAEQMGTQINFNEGVAVSYSSYLPDSETVLDKWTIENVYMANGVYGNHNAIKMSGSLENTSFTTMVHFPSDGLLNLWVGEELNGFALQGKDDFVSISHYTSVGGQVVQTFTKGLFSDVAGVDLTENDNLKMTMTVENVDDKGVKVGIYFNDVLYDGRYFYIAGLTSDMLPRNIQIRKYGQEDIVLKVPIDASQSAQLPSDVERITLLDAAITDGTSNMFSGKLDVDSLDGTLFSARFNYNLNSSRFHFGANDSNAFSGISFRLEGDELVVGNEVGENGIVNLPFYLVKLNAQTAGIGTTFVNQEFLLQISTEYVDHDEDGNKNDIKLGVFIDGQLYNNQYLYIKDGAEQLGTQINFNEGNAVLYSSYLPDGETTLDEWTIENVYMASGAYGDYNAIKMAGSLENTSFTTVVDFPSDGLLNLWVGEELNGFALQGKDDFVSISHYTRVNEQVVQTFTRGLFSDIAGVDLTENDNLKMTLTVETVDDKGIKVGVYFNDVLYNGQYFHIAGITSDMLPRNIQIRKYGQEDIVLGVPVDISQSTDLPLDAERITLLDADVSDGINSMFSGKLNVDSLDGTLFSARLNYSAESSRFHFGANDSNAFSGISFRLEGDELVAGNEVGENGIANLPFYLVKLNAQTAGIGTTFVNQEFLLQISTEFIDHDKDGNKNDIKLGVFIDGQLYNGQYLYIKDGTEQLGTQINFNEGNAVMYASYDYQKGFEEITATEFGLNNVVICDKTVTQKYDDNTFAATALTMLMKFSEKKGDCLYLGGKDVGIKLQKLSSEKIKVSFVDSKQEIIEIVTLNPKKAGVTSFDEKQLEWRFEIRINELGNENRVKLGIYVNEKLYESRYYELENVETSSLKRVLSIHSKGGTFEIATQLYEELTFHDFSILDTEVEGEYYIQNYCDFNTLDNSAVTGIVNFGSTGENRFTLGGGGWGGLNFIRMSDGSIWVVFVVPDVEQRSVVYIKPSQVGMDTFDGKELEIRTTYDIWESDEGVYNLKLGIYINGQLYNSQYCMVDNVDLSQLTRTMRLRVLEGTFKAFSIKKEPDLSIYGF